jgi:hypothetical protein
VPQVSVVELGVPRLRAGAARARLVRVSRRRRRPEHDRGILTAHHRSEFREKRKPRRSRRARARGPRRRRERNRAPCG